MLKASVIGPRRHQKASVLALGYEVAQHLGSGNATHVVFKKK